MIVERELGSKPHKIIIIKAFYIFSSAVLPPYISLSFCFSLSIARRLLPIPNFFIFCLVLRVSVISFRNNIGFSHETITMKLGRGKWNQCNCDHINSELMILMRFFSAIVRNMEIRRFSH